MKKNTKYTIVATLILGTGAIAGTWMAVDKHKKDAELKKKTETSIKKIQYEDAQLNALELRFNKKSINYADSAANYAKQNPQYDDMNSLYNMSMEMAEIVDKNYQILKKNFLKKISTIGKDFCYPGGKYNFIIGDQNNYRRPIYIEDWMQILRDNRSQVPNMAAIEKESEQLEILEDLMEQFFMFIAWDMYTYTDIDSQTKQDYKKRIVQTISDEAIYDSEVIQLDDQSYRFVDAIHAFNNIDNVKQNEIIDRLFDDYLLKFAAYNKRGMVVLDKKLFKKMKVLASTIKQHNEIESGKISYDRAVADIANQKQINAKNIETLQQHIK